MRRGLDFSELKAYAETLRSEVENRSFEDFLKRFLIDNAEQVLALAKPRTPKDTGATMASWGLGEENFHVRSAVNRSQRESWAAQEIDYRNLGLEIVKVDGNNMTLMLYNSMPYSSYLEYGTPGKPGWKWAAGAHMMTISVDEVYNMMPSRYEQAFEKWAAERGL